MRPRKPVACRKDEATGTSQACFHGLFPGLRKCRRLLVTPLQSAVVRAGKLPCFRWPQVFLTPRSFGTRSLLPGRAAAQSVECSLNGWTIKGLSLSIEAVKRDAASQISGGTTVPSHKAVRCGFDAFSLHFVARCFRNRPERRGHRRCPLYVVRIRKVENSESPDCFLSNWHLAV